VYSFVIITIISIIVTLYIFCHWYLINSLSLRR